MQQASDLKKRKFKFSKNNFSLLFFIVENCKLILQNLKFFIFLCFKILKKLC